MQKISNAAELKASIRELEMKSKYQEQSLKAHGRSTVQSLKPANLVRVGLTGAKKVAVTRDIRALAINTFIGLAAGYLTRRIIMGKSPNIFKRTLGVAVQAAITKLVHKKLPVVQQKAIQLIEKRRSRNSY